MQLEVRPFVAPAFGENGYVVWTQGASEAVIIDPGEGVEPAMLELLDQQQLEAVAVLLSHAHIDHIQGVKRIVEATGAPVYLHPADRILYDNVEQQGSMFGLRVETPPPVDHDLAHGQKLQLAGITFDVRHVPGHAPGHVLFHVADAGMAFVGDIIFQASIGRSDLPGGDYAQLMRGIREQVLTLPDDTVAWTGHGPSTSIGHERVANPFLIPHYGGGLA
ncbi:MBL fold metallo-hydrolase [soil metagenome]